MLLGYPQVVLWVNGHTHVNAVFAHKRTRGTGGFWELNTASHIDWPQQAGSSRSWTTTTGPCRSSARSSISSPPIRTRQSSDAGAARRTLAELLSANDWQERTGHSASLDGRRGKPSDRNVELLVAAPFATGRTRRAHAATTRRAALTHALGLAP